MLLEKENYKINIFLWNKLIEKNKIGMHEIVGHGNFYYRELDLHCDDNQEYSVKYKKGISMHNIICVEIKKFMI